MLAVALEGLDNTLKAGQANFINDEGENHFATILENEGALDNLEELQQHPNHNIYEAAMKIVD